MKVIIVIAVLAANAALAAETVEPWAPRNISSAKFESHAAFDPLTGDLWFVRSNPDFSGWRLFVSQCTANGWSVAHPAPISGDGVEADPWFTPDGRTLWFISSRSTDGIKRTDTDIWRVSRNAGGAWGTPERLPAPVNSEKYEWFPRVAPDGWLYFGSGQAGGLGKTDIWRAREENGKWVSENLGPTINTAKNEYEPLPTPDGKYLIVQTDDSYLRSTRTATGWSKGENMGTQINANGSEVGATISPSGSTLLFARDTKGERSGEFFVAHLGPKEDWPPRCPR